MVYLYCNIYTIKSKGGEYMHSIGVALLFNLTDLVTGLIAAVKAKELQSTKLRDGIFKKIGFLISYFLALMIDTYGSEVGFALEIKILPIVLGFVCLTEVISIIENISKITDILPEKLLSIFHISKEDNNG